MNLHFLDFNTCTDDQMEITIWDRDVGAKDDFIGM